MTQKQIYWVRHGTSYGNVFTIAAHLYSPRASIVAAARERAYAPGGPELTPLGRQQASATGAFLADRQVDRLVCSSLPRAIQTADAVRRAMGRPDLPIEVAPYVQELRNPARDPKDVARFASDNDIRHVRMLYPRRWSPEPSLDRFRALLDEVAPDASVVVVSHGNLLQDVTGGPLMRNAEVYVEDHAGARPLFRPPGVDSNTLGGKTGFEQLWHDGAFDRRADLRGGGSYLPTCNLCGTEGAARDHVIQMDTPVPVCPGCTRRYGLRTVPLA